MLGHADAGTGVMQAFPVFPVSKFCIVAVFMGDGAMVDGLGASVADIRSFIETVTAFPYKVGAGLVAGRTGGAFHITKHDLMAHIRLPAVIAVDAEVMGIIKSAFVTPVTEAVGSDLLGDGSRIFAEIFGDLLKREPLIQGSFNISAVTKGKVLLVSWYVFTHGEPPSTAVRRTVKAYH